MKNERHKHEMPKGPMIIRVKNKPKLAGFTERELAEMYEEVQKEAKFHSPDQGGKSVKNGVLVQANQYQADIPEGSNHIKLDSDGYPIHPTEEYKFRKLNKIVGVDRWRTIFWVEAKNSYGIMPGAGYELKAHIYKQKSGLFLIDFGMRMEEDINHFRPRRYDASGVIVPRKVRLVADIMLGYTHNPIVLDSFNIPDNAFDDIKKANENYWEPPYFED